MKKDRRTSLLFESQPDLEEKLIGGIESGSAGKISSKDWRSLKRRVKAKVGKRVSGEIKQNCAIRVRFG